MAGLLEIWRSELVKLGWRENFIPAKFVGEESSVAKKEATTAAAVNGTRQRSYASISEATMCLLMDRFSPS
ncbi:hypothetical protein KFK09_016499 [Dendrobium nobile]|uniref:Uncharacterized protein n=1 Tax=Dendrobium nobile TaxID=94219 RepID=A0A8T3AZR1_DENNO|nr:hypothetical protein KFK09_016499 [Dendrobium nobile]